MLAVIGGSGFYSLGNVIDEMDVITPYGTVKVDKVKIGNGVVLFVPRHGKGHHVPPHKINYKDHIYALKKLGASAVIASYATGGMSKYKPGDIVLLDDFLGFNTPITFYDSFSQGMKHVDFTEPFNRKLQALVMKAAKSAKVSLKKGGIIATMPGPRFETRAEIKALQKMGANLVSMTCAYEVILAHELGIPFVGLATVTNLACGLSKKEITTEEVMETLNRSKGKINSIIVKLSALVH
ncbi:MAG: MTAP family purine nucleoside phosphorylase [Candidatus Micrarchaeota archaeon]